MSRPDARSASSAAHRSVRPSEERPPLPTTVAPEVAEAMLAVTPGERDRLLLRTLWATGARVGTVLALRPRDVSRTTLRLIDLKNPQAPGSLVALGKAHADLPGQLLLWAHEHALAEDEPLFFSRQRGADRRRRPITRQQAWQIVTLATERIRATAQDDEVPRIAASRPKARPSGAVPSKSPSALGQPAAVDQVRLTNVGPPQVRARLVSRPHLVKALDDVPQHPVTLVSAPAGFGKTTTLATWAAQVGGRLAVAWLSLGIGDNDPVRFWRGVVSALQTQQPAVGASALARLQAGAPIALVVDDLLDDLAGLAAALVLVLDDCHVIETTEVHASLATLVSHCPPFFHLVLSTRSDPPLPLARLRSLGQLLELRAADLHFSKGEAAGLLDDALGVELDHEQVALLAERTEGWAAGLHLAALSLRAQADLSAALSAFAGTDRGIVDYFAEEILDHLPDAMRVFLERSSILERLHPALCDAVVGEPGSGTLLEVLERGNVFITPVDQGRQWFRYHQLFADALRHRLQRETPRLIPELHELASAWYEANALPEPALEHALAAERWDRAARLLGRLFGALIRGGEEMTVRRWLQALPEEICQCDPVLAQVTATTLLMTGEAARLEAFLAAAEPQLDSAGERQALGILLSNHAQLAVNRDDPDGALTRAQRALELLPAEPGPYRAQAFGAIVQCHLRNGDPAAAAQEYDQMGAAITRDMRVIYWSRLLYGADRMRQLGDLRRAAVEYRAALDEIGERTVFARHQAWLGSSAIALEWNRLAEAADYLERGREMERLSGRIYRTVQAATLIQRARVLRASGQLAAADETLHQAEDAARQQESTRSERLAQAECAWLALLDGRAAAAEGWAEALERTGLETYAREPEALVLARVRRARGSGGALVPFLEALLLAADRVGRSDSTIAILVQLALVREQVGDTPGALAALERAVRLAQPAGYTRVFLDEGEPMLALLRQLLRCGVSPDHVTGLLHAFGTSGQRSASTTELLTPREREVLRLLARGLSNRTIAERLVTSEATIKSHVHHLIDKLGVASRAEVLVRARELGELDAISGPGGAG